MLKHALPTLLALSATAALLLHTGCGIITAPVSAPAAVLENANFNLTFSIENQNGQPLPGVTMHQQLNHHFWTPIAGGTDTDEHKTLQLSDHAQINERGQHIEFTFSHENYFDANYNMLATDNHLLITPYGNWPYSAPFPIVMIPRSAPDAPLRLWQGTIAYADYPTQRILELPKLWAVNTSLYVDPNRNQFNYGLRQSPDGSTNVVTLQPLPQGPGVRGLPAPLPRNSQIPVAISSNANASEPASLPPGSLYLTLTTTPPRPLNAKGELNPLEVNLPQRITLHLTGPDSGLVRLTPRLGYPPILTADTAPTTGYQPSLTIDRPRLQEMRTATQDRILEAHEYFYIQSAGHFGKGYIAWSQTFDPKTKAPTPLSFRYTFWIQPSPNDPTLTYHHGLAK